MKFIFWNTHGNNNAPVVAQLAREHDPDYIILAEAQSHESAILVALNPPESTDYSQLDSLGCERITIFSRLSPQYASVLYETPRITIQQISPPGIEAFLLACAHMPSKLFANERDQAGHCEDLARAIAEVENGVGHTRTVLVGDLNQNPYEEGIVSAKGLHAVMSAQIAARNTRTFNGVEYRMFYNPMWGKYGDTTPGPCGTYYHASSGKCETFWHIFDQVLIRPELLPRFQKTKLRILDGCDTGALVSVSGAPLADVVSDHLPLMFELGM